MSSTRSHRHTPEWQVWAALLIVYLVWGSTYLAIRLVVETMPPLLSASARFLVAGAILAGLIGWRQGLVALRVTREQVLGAAFVGLALLLGGNGLVMLGERMCQPVWRR
jgi:drug/metabolite transporter (DMT)-like permease